MPGRLPKFEVAATDESLYANLLRLFVEMRRQGTTKTEIKSGYGLTVADELRSLRIASGKIAMCP